MTTVTESHLKRLEDLIINRVSDLDQKIDGLDQKIEGLDKRVEGLDQKVDELDRKVDALEIRFDKLETRMDKLSEEVNDARVDLGTIKGKLKRLDHLEFTNRTIFVAIVTALMAGLVKMFFSETPNR